MSAAAATRAPGAAPARVPRRGARWWPAALWLAAALISGFTLRRYLDPFDEGLLLTAAERIVHGQWPYADFAWSYGPGHPLLMALAAKGLGPSVLWWRLVRTAADATVALLVFVLVRREAGTRWGLAAWLAAAVTMAQPTVANPFPVALALGLGALLAATDRRPVAAGLLLAAAAFWRPDFGLAAGGAVLAAFAVARAGRGALVAAVVALGASALAWAPFVVAAGPHALWENLVAVSAREGGAWRLPFPLLYDGPLVLWPPGDALREGKDLAGFELPLVALTAGILAALVVARRPRPAAAGMAVLGAFGALYLGSRADEFHAQPLAVSAAALLALAAATAAGALRAVLAVLLAFVVLAGAANRISALVLPPDLVPVHLRGVPGIRVPPGEAGALPRLAADVARRVPPGRAIYVAPRRSDLVTFTDPLLYFLLDRPPLLAERSGLPASASAQARVVAALRRARPLVIRWTDPLSSKPEPNARGRPSGSRTLDAYLAARYAERARYGAYVVLAPRP